MFDVGVPELVLILVVALVVFGPGKLPEIGASIGKAIKDFRGATQAISNEVNAVKNFDILAEDEETTRRIMAEKKQAEAASAAPAASTETPVAAVPPPPLTTAEQVPHLDGSIALKESLRPTMGDPSTDAIIATIRARIEALQRESPQAEPVAAIAEPAAVAA